VKSVIPAIKATIAKELVETHNLKQGQVAQLLAVSQSAVSKYTRKIRGHTININHAEEVQPLINKMINLLLEEKPQRAEFLNLFCETCKVIRKKGLMCHFCQKTDPKIQIEQCKFCLSNSCKI